MHFLNVGVCCDLKNDHKPIIRKPVIVAFLLFKESQRAADSRHVEEVEGLGGGWGREPKSCG